MANGDRPILDLKDKDVLQILGELLTSPIRAVGKGIEATKEGLETFGTILGVGSTFQPGVEGEGQRIKQELIRQLTQQPPPQLNPLQENVLKTVQKAQGKQVEEALAMGTKGEQVLQNAGISIASNQPVSEEGQADSTLALTGVQPPELSQALGGGQQQPQAQTQDFKGNKLLNALSFLIPGIQTIQKAILTNQVARQKIAGQEPIQPKDLATLQLNSLKELNSLEKQGLLKPNDVFTKFENAAKPFIIARDAQARIEAIQLGTGFDDLGLIFSFMKVLDPNSVVRESEFANAEQAASFLDRVYGKGVRFTTGGRLSSKSRGELISTSRRLFKAAQRQMDKGTKQFTDLAIRNRINPKAVIRDVGLSLPQTQSISQGTTQSGNKFRRQ